MSKKICIIRDDRLGDLILTLPVVEALKHENDVEITLLCSHINKNLARNTKLFESIIVFTEGIFNQMKLIRNLRKEKFDYIINCSPFKNRFYKILLSGKYKATSLLLSRYKRNSSLKKLFFKTLLNLFYNHVQIIDRYENRLQNNISHQTNIVLKLLNNIGLKLNTLKSYNFSPNHYENKNIIIIHLSNQWLLDTRINQLKELMRLINQENRYKLILTTEKKIHSQYKEILKGITLFDKNHKMEINKTYLCFEQSFDDWIETLNLASHVITPECGCSHVATMLGKKTIIIYDESNHPNLINKEYEPYKNHYTKLVFKKDDVVADIMQFLK